MPKLNIVIIGASRGIGLGFVKNYLAASHYFISTHPNTYYLLYF